MNLSPLSPSVGLYVSGLLLTASVALWVRILLPRLRTGPVADAIRRNEHSLERKLIFLRLGIPARQFMLGQVALAVVGLLVLILVPPVGIPLVALALGLPALIESARKKRTALLEKQIEGWLTSMARSLEAAPSLGEALESTTTTCDSPMREEIEQLVSEMRLGRPLDQALSEWSERVGSRTLTMAVSTLLVGRETGGRIGEVLRSAASALREMERLEGVVRTKTAEGKGQAWVISIVPFPLYLAIRTTDPTYFVPLEQTATGHLLLAIAAGLWLAATLSARKILAVQI